MRRPERIAESVREEVIQIVGYELEDPRVQGVTVTDVRMSDNLRDARVYVTVEGSEAETRAALEALRHAETYVRRQLGLALNLRHAPHVHFVRDTVEERAQRVDQLLYEIEHERHSPEQDFGDSKEGERETLNDGREIIE
jgi:ribosome-binding factor A